MGHFWKKSAALARSLSRIDGMEQASSLSLQAKEDNVHEQ
jgi:hypothetical protein